jgi:AraC family transcriptional regulator of adaptative response/methylated-DNA-[protein]-cysteine methyltransferase
MHPVAPPVKSAPACPSSPGDYQRIARAIDFLRRRADAHPSLAEVGAELGLSPFHLQRLFSRWAGISPKRFLQALTADRAKARLRAAADVLTASLDVGLSGPGRLHDLFVSLEAMTPGEYKGRGAGLVIRHGFGPTPLGDCFVAATERGICALEFADTPAARSGVAGRFRREWPEARQCDDHRAAAEMLARVFARGSPGARPLSVLVRGTNFQVQVWRALLRIPPGATQTYQGVAVAIGRPRAHRAVAGAVAANRVAILIPCHRVLRRDGELGGYRWGETRKAAALLWDVRGARAQGSAITTAMAKPS